MTLPYEEVVNGQDGTIVHWDIRKDTNSEISDFAIFNDQNNRIDHNSDNSLNDILSLRNVAKSASLKDLSIIRSLKNNYDYPQ